MNTFTENESYKHKMAKEVLKEWFYGGDYIGDDWLIQNGVDVVDMELFAIAAVAHDHQINWLSYKFISDEANESSGLDWSKQVSYGQQLFLEKLDLHLKTMDQ